MISKMAKPEEVLVVENENGEVVREFMRDTDSINLYKNMRETLVYLTHLDYADTERIMTEKLLNQVNGTEWSWKNLNTVNIRFLVNFSVNYSIRLIELLHFPVMLGYRQYLRSYAWRRWETVFSHGYQRLTGAVRAEKRQR